MTQAQLVKTLQEKIGFVWQFDRKNVTSLRPTPKAKKGKRVKKRPHSKGSVELVAPDSMLQAPYPLRFNMRERKVHREQIEKVANETGLDYHLQRDLAECRLDPDTAKLIFFCHRLADATGDIASITLSCKYVEEAKAKLGSPSASKSLWGGTRTRYLPVLKTLRRRIERQKGLALGEKTAECLDDFLAYLAKVWGIN
jgi:hypothetical protein